MKTRRTTRAFLLAVSAIVVACSEGREAERADEAGSPGSASVAQPSPAAPGVDHSTMEMPNNTAPRAAGPVPDESGDMAGMDHSTMSMPAPGAADRATPAAGNPSAARRAANNSGMAGMAGMGAMDHSGMDMPASGSQARRPSGGTAATAQGMAGMPGMKGMSAPSGRSAGTTSMPGMQGMQGMSGMQGPAGMNHEGMSMPGSARMPPPDPSLEKLQQMVQILTRDPLVRQRIQADTILRNRWADPDVRKILLGTR